MYTNIKSQPTTKEYKPSDQRANNHQLSSNTHPLTHIFIYSYNNKQKQNKLTHKNIKMLIKIKRNNKKG